MTNSEPSAIDGGRLRERMWAEPQCGCRNRYGHRWCNVSMTDHSIYETLDFMEHVVRVHGRC